jgi:hypothetical protein
VASRTKITLAVAKKNASAMPRFAYSRSNAASVLRIAWERARFKPSCVILKSESFILIPMAKVSRRCSLTERFLVK